MQNLTLKERIKKNRCFSSLTYPDFWDFMMEGGYALLFPDDEDQIYECPYCGRVINGDEKVEWINKMKRIFKCPECKEELKIE